MTQPVKTAGMVGTPQYALAVSTATGLTVPAGATHAVIDNSGNAAVRWRADGTSPTATAGNRILAGGSLALMDLNINYRDLLIKFKGIQEASTGTLEVTYFTFS